MFAHNYFYLIINTVFHPTAIGKQKNTLKCFDSPLQIQFYLRKIKTLQFIINTIKKFKNIDFLILIVLQFEKCSNWLILAAIRLDVSRICILYVCYTSLKTAKFFRKIDVIDFHQLVSCFSYYYNETENTHFSAHLQSFSPSLHLLVKLFGSVLSRSFFYKWQFSWVIVQKSWRIWSPTVKMIEPFGKSFISIL